MVHMTTYFTCNISQGKRFIAVQYRLHAREGLIAADQRTH